MQRLLATAARALTSPSTAAGSSPTSLNTSTESSPGRIADDLRALAQDAANILDDIHRASTASTGDVCVCSILSQGT